MNVIKLGGAAINHTNISHIFNNLHLNNFDNNLLVISAFGKLSTKLKNVIEYYKNDFNINNVYKLFEPYSNLLKDKYKSEFQNYLDSTENRTFEILNGLKIIDEIPKQSVDEILSFGELVSSFYIYCLLKSYGYDCTFLDSREVIKTDSNFGNANPDISNSIELICGSVSRNKLVVTQGFIGSDIHNKTTTMGFESSNLSALIFAEALGSKEIDIITKNDYIMTSDPEIIENTKEVLYIPYESAIVLSKNGFKLLYPGMIELAQKNNITLNYRSIYKEIGTIISKERELGLPVILEKENTLIITPIEISKSIKIISELESVIDNFEYESFGFTLKIKSEKQIIQLVNDYIISLYGR